MFPLPRLHLRDSNLVMVRAWRKEFAGTDVEITEGNILANGLRSEAIVSPANSYGAMDGGIDAAYLHRWPDVQQNVQFMIRDVFYGEMPVGAAWAVRVYDPCFRWLLVCPTMRVPADVSTSENAYWAFRAMLIEATNNSRESVVCPGFCTGVGHMPAVIAAEQMRAAYDQVVNSLAQRERRRDRPSPVA